MTRKIMMAAPSLRDILQEAAEAFPTGYKLPPQVLIRIAYVEHKLDFTSGAEFNFPGYGLLKTKGREFRFEFENSYWKEKGFPTNCMEGTW